ncbi:hypothetical protein SB816_32200, partial [Achromobacter sp. SIMBA_011]|uniref:hypothetical protein n=1 Tax=Achromobacter sp. SIMBA_011 TaxID=3085759 RepID=UPI00397D7E95
IRNASMATGVRVNKVLAVGSQCHLGISRTSELFPYVKFLRNYLTNLGADVIRRLLQEKSAELAAM